MKSQFVDHDEARLINGTRQRNSQAFAQLYQRYLPLICKVWYQFQLPGCGLDDWQQEAAIVLYRATCQFKQQDVRFCWYIRQALTNRMRDLYRQQAAKKRVPFGRINYLAEAGIDDHTVDRQLRPDEIYRLRVCYQHFLETCSPLERATFLEINRGNSIQDTASTCHCTPRRVRSALERARKKLHSSLDDEH